MLWPPEEDEAEDELLDETGPGAMGAGSLEQWAIRRVVNASKDETERVFIAAADATN
jgi:hypothetical protein